MLHPSRAPIALSLALIFCQPFAMAQKVVWQIPERGVVFYDRTSTGSLPVTSSVMGRSEPVMPAVLLDGELDPKKQFVRRPAAVLRELDMALAFDLRQTARGGKFTMDFPNISGVGALQLTGKTGKADGEGVQTIEAAIEPVEAKGGAAGRGGFGREELTPIKGTIVVRRKVDGERGLVTWFESELKAHVVVAAAQVARAGGAGGRGPGGRRPGGRGPGGRGAVGGAAGATSDSVFSQTWNLREVKVNRYPGFNAEVADAIRTGSDFIKAAVRSAAGGQLFRDPDSATRTYDSGLLALCLLTLVKADVDRDDEVLVKGFADLRKRKLVDTYSLSLALMAMEALYAPVDERTALLEGRIVEPVKRVVPQADLDLMQEWTTTLLKNVDSSAGNTAYVLRFHYTPNAAYDNSNTQYALLGLYSAYLCGVPISPTVWFANAKHWLTDQKSDKAAAPVLRLVSHQQYAQLREGAAAQGSRRTVVRGRKITGSGWPYKVRGSTGGGRRGGFAPSTPLTGSMTTAGLTGVSICDAVLRSLKKGGTVLGQISKSKETGFAWMLHNFSVRDNPNGRHYHYYIYGLERACELNRVALLGNRDWYFEGASMLLGLLDGGSAGGFRRGPARVSRGLFQGDLTGTCFSVLFLKISAPPLPVITGKR